jgi:hypothetical protein
MADDLANILFTNGRMMQRHMYLPLGSPRAKQKSTAGERKALGLTFPPTLLAWADEVRRVTGALSLTA